MMCRWMTGICQVQSCAKTDRGYAFFKRMLGAAALTGVLGFAPAFAKEPADSNSKSPDIGVVTQTQPAELPQCLNNLKLTAPQQTQIQGIVRDYDESLAQVWKQFGERYMQSIAMESSLLAAIEDNLTDVQRQQVREQRRKTARHEKSIAGTTDKLNRETTKPVSAVDQETGGVGITLTDEQAALADKIQDKYRAQLRSLNRDIEGLHTRLVSLEADRLVEIEKVLTKDQLAQLRLNRQAAPDAPKITVGQMNPASAK